MKKFYVVLLFLLTLLIGVLSKPHQEKFLAANEENSQAELINLRNLDDDEDEDPDEDPDEPSSGNPNTTGQTTYHKSSGGISGGGVAAIVVSVVVVVVAVVAILVVFQTGAIAAFSSAAVAKIGRAHV